jgi:hypothetical protein
MVVEHGHSDGDTLFLRRAQSSEKRECPPGVLSVPRVSECENVSVPDPSVPRVRKRECPRSECPRSECPPSVLIHRENKASHHYVDGATRETAFYFSWR